MVAVQCIMTKVVFFSRIKQKKSQVNLHSTLNQFSGYCFQKLFRFFSLYLINKLRVVVEFVFNFSSVK